MCPKSSFGINTDTESNVSPPPFCPANHEGVPVTADLRARPVNRSWRPRLLRVGTDPDPRFSLANERTFLAWSRTALGAIAAALALETLTVQTDSGTTHRALIIGLLVFAVLLTAGALARWFRIEIAMRTGRPLPLPGIMLLMAILVASGTAAVAVLTFT